MLEFCSSLSLDHGGAVPLDSGPELLRGCGCCRHDSAGSQTVGWFSAGWFAELVCSYSVCLTQLVLPGVILMLGITNWCLTTFLGSTFGCVLQGGVQCSALPVGGCQTTGWISVAVCSGLSLQLGEVVPLGSDPVLVLLRGCRGCWHDSAGDPTAG